MNEINIIPIGSGSTGNSIYIEILDHRFLIDMGIGFRKIRDALALHDRNINDIEAIFLTHGHSDHTKAAKAIANNTSCKVYADQSSMYAIRDINAERVILESSTTYEILPGLKVRMFPVPHDYVRTCGFVFEYQGKKLGYVTDCGKMNEIIIDEIAGSDVIVIESNHDIEMLKNGPYPKDLQRRILSKYGHLSNDDCAETIATLYDKGSRNFILAHISLNNNTVQLA